MIIVGIYNSECSITGLSVAQFKELRKILSYKPSAQASFHSGRHNTNINLMNQKGVFPTGLLYLVQNFLINDIHEIKDLRIVPKPQESLLKADLAHIPYREQLEAAKVCRLHGRGIVSMPTGTGKSLVCALIIKELQVPTLVVVPSLELKTQLTKSLSEIFGADKVGPGESIFVQNVDALDPNVVSRRDCAIIDEFHHSGAKSYRKLNKKAWSRVYYKFGLTATPFRSQDNERLLLESVLSQVIYELDYQTAVDNGYIVPVEGYFIEIPTKRTLSGNKASWPSMYSELIVNNETRNEIIRDLILKLYVNNVSALCLVKEIKHGHNISLGNLPFMHGDSETGRMDLLSFLLRERPVLIGTTGVLGEGIDTKPAEYIIIAGLGKSKNSIMQQIGRGVRRFEDKESCKVILFRDLSHKWTKAHFAAQCKILKEEYGVVPVKLEIS